LTDTLQNFGRRAIPG